MSESEPFLIDIGYPVYGAKFISDKELVVAGGGGYGSHGIPNRLVSLKPNLFDFVFLITYLTYMFMLFSLF